MSSLPCALTADCARSVFVHTHHNSNSHRHITLSLITLSCCLHTACRLSGSCRSLIAESICVASAVLRLLFCCLLWLSAGLIFAAAFGWLGFRRHFCLHATKAVASTAAAAEATHRQVTDDRHGDSKASATDVHEAQIASESTPLLSTALATSRLLSCCCSSGLRNKLLQERRRLIPSHTLHIHKRKHTHIHSTTAD